MTDYIIIALLAVLVLDTDIVKRLWYALVQLSKHIKHLIYRPFVKFAHWRHIKRISNDNAQ